MSEEDPKRSPEEAERVRKIRRIFWLIIGPVLIFFGLVWLTVPSRDYRRTEFTAAVSSAKRIFYGFFDFEQAQQAYPNATTAKKLEATFSTKEGLLRTDTAEGCLNQLIVDGKLDGNGVYPRSRDFDGRAPKDLLRKGDCFFAYVVWEEGDSAALPDDAPLLLGPLKKGKLRFDEKAWKDEDYARAVILKVSGAVVGPEFDEDGRLILNNGKDYFDWSQPHWGGKKPRIVWPE